jgi:hypothetical protein
MTAAEAKILAFAPRCENCRKPFSACTCDSWVGCCSSCGLEVYGGDEHRMEYGRPVCGECIAEELTWRMPEEVTRKAA